MTRPLRFAALLAAAALPACAAPPLAPSTAASLSRLENATVAEAAAWAAARTGKAYLVDASLEGRITLYAPAELTAEETRELFAAALTPLGYGLQAAGPGYRIARAEPPAPTAEGLQTDAPGTWAATAEDLVEAADQGREDDMRRHLGAGLDPNGTSKASVTPLLAAAGRGNLRIVRLLVEAGAAVDLAPGSGRSTETALSRAVRKGHADVAAYLIDRGAAPQRSGYGGLPLVSLAAQTRSEALVRLLLARGAKADVPDGQGLRPIHHAAASGDAGIVSLLLEAGVLPDGPAPSPVALALAKGHQEAADALLGAKADPTLALESLLEQAQVAGGRVEYLLRAGARMDRIGRDGFPPLLLAAERAHAEAAQVLLAAGADVTARDPLERTAAHLAARSTSKGNPVLIAVAAAGGDLDAVDAWGWSPLTYAASRGDAAMVLFLLGRGAEPNRQDLGGLTPLHHAARSGAVEVARHLVAAGGDPRLADDLGKLPVDLVAASKRDSLASALGPQPGDRPPSPVPPGRPSRPSPASLIAAAKAGDVAGLREYAATGGSLNIGASTPNEAQTTALRAAAEKGHLEAARFLVEQGAFLDAFAGRSSGPASTPVVRAAEEGQEAVVRFLLEAGARPDGGHRGESGHLLSALVIKGNLELLRLAVERGADLTARQRHGTLLAAAAANGRTSVLAYLLEQGADPNEPSSGQAPLALAALKADRAAVERLVAAGADAAVALLGAAGNEKGGPEAVRLLLELRPALEIVDSKGRTPLLGACDSGSEEAARLLLEQGADPLARDPEGRTALHLAAARGQAGLVQALVAAGVGVDLPDASGRTPLMAAAGGNRRAAAALAEICRFLVARGADPNAADERGDTALHHASRAGNAELALLLVGSGADPSRRNREGKEPSQMQSRR